MIRIMIQLPEEQAKTLKELAKARKTSVAKLVRESVAQYVVASDQEAKIKEKRAKALQFIRKIKNGEARYEDIEGKTDVAKNHDQYLAEIYGK
jgi:metal-responsive CopG/Arc/MetJ family transcriptional regulator